MASTAADIQDLYIAYFGRPADPSGLAYWLSEANQPGRTTAQISTFFGTAPEFTTRIGGLSVNQAINTFYVNLFNRQADEGGLLFWSQAVNSGRITLQQAGWFIASNPSASDATILNNKVTSATLWTTNTNTTAEILSYGTATGQQSGITFLAGITTTAATTAQTDAAIAAMVTASGGGTGGITFNQIAQNAILTNNANQNGTGNGNGFTPSANFLSNGNDIISLGVFSGAIIQDGSSTDNDTLLLNAAGINTVASTVVGVETITLAGNASFIANQLAGVTTLNFAQAGILNGFSGAASGAINVYNSGINTLGAGGGNYNSAVSINFSAIANGGRFNLSGGTTALALNFDSTVNSFTFAQTAGAARQALQIRGAGSAFTLNLAGSAAYTAAGGFISAGGNISVNNTANDAGVFGTTANVFTFGTAGTNTYTVGVAGNAINANQNFGGVSGLDRINFATTAGNGGGAFAGIALSANFKNGALALGFGTAATAGNALTGLFVANDIFISAASASVAGTSDTLTLSFLSDSATSGLIFSAGSIVASGVETISMNLYGTAGAFNIESAFSAADATRLNVFSLNAGFVSFGSTLGNSGFRNFGFSQADGGVTFTLSSAFATAAATQFTLFAGSGNDVISFRNQQNSGAISAIFGNGTLSALISNLNTIDISDGGADVVNLGFGQVTSFISAASAGNVYRARIVGFGVGDVLSFTGNSTAVSAVATLTAAALSANAANTGLIGLFFDGSDTLVFFAGSADVTNNAGYSQLALAGVIAGADYSSAARWNLAGGALQLIA